MEAIGVGLMVGPSVYFLYAVVLGCFGRSDGFRPIPPGFNSPTNVRFTERR